MYNTVFLEVIYVTRIRGKTMSFQYKNNKIKFLWKRICYQSIPDNMTAWWKNVRWCWTLYLSHDMTKQTNWVCAQRRLRSAWASAQSDQSLRCALNGYVRTQSFFLRTAKILIKLGRCPGWSESSLGAHSLCWFCHVVAHFILSIVLVDLK